VAFALKKLEEGLANLVARPLFTVACHFCLARNFNSLVLFTQIFNQFCYADRHPRHRLVIQCFRFIARDCDSSDSEKARCP
jgi:hypothetical protein